MNNTNQKTNKLSKNSHHHFKLFFYVVKSRDSGLTLIELVVVFIFLSLLSIIALPAFFRQVGKARNVEMQNVLGSINRAQQVYHFEKQQFAQGGDDSQSLRILGIGLDTKYIDDNGYNITANADSATVSLVNSEFEQDGTKGYSGATFFNAGIYGVTACESEDVAESIPPPNSPGDCGANQVLQ